MRTGVTCGFSGSVRCREFLSGAARTALLRCRRAVWRGKSRARSQLSQLSALEFLPRTETMSESVETARPSVARCLGRGLVLLSGVAKSHRLRSRSLRQLGSCWFLIGSSMGHGTWAVCRRGWRTFNGARVRTPQCFSESRPSGFSGWLVKGVAHEGEGSEAGLVWSVELALPFDGPAKFLERRSRLSLFVISARPGSGLQWFQHAGPWRRGRRRNREWR